MDRTIRIPASDYTGADQLYFVLYSDASLVSALNTSSTLTETFNSANWSSYAIEIVHSGDWIGNLPDAPAGRYFVVTYIQEGSTPASSDLHLGAFGEIWLAGTADGQMRRQLADDAKGLLADYGESILYTPSGGSAKPIQALVRRRLPAAVSEDHHNLTDLIELSFSTDPTDGVSVIAPERDLVTVSGRFGGTPTEHLITIVVSGDGGMWKVRAR